ncbi:DUF805 domain-containing protein [Polycladidibacter stylochi]|uniref:DUF805 domain-containing protein n=1 Tax=Polycladidibacter stylochi TaxID=1807766 RepID=UPI000829799C|nr:DUF805 domain-containing protein [Pseudovibrio stylochi]
MNQQYSNQPEPIKNRGNTVGVLWVFFNPRGRLSRLAYWLGFILMMLIMLLAFYNATKFFINDIPITGDISIDLNEFIFSNPMLPILLIASKWSELALVMKRLQDADYSGFWGLLVMVPYLNFIVCIVVGFLPPTKGPNIFGRTSNSRPPAKNNHNFHRTRRYQ